MTGLPGVFRSAFLRGKTPVRLRGSTFPRPHRFSGVLAQAPPSAAFRPTGFRGKHRSGGTQRLVPVLRLAVLSRLFALLPHSLAFALAQDLSDLAEVGGEDGEADRPLKPVRVVHPDPVQSAVLQAVDRRLHSRMLAPGRREGRLRLALGRIMFQKFCNEFSRGVGTGSGQGSGRDSQGAEEGTACQENLGERRISGTEAGTRASDRQQSHRYKSVHVPYRRWIAERAFT